MSEHNITVQGGTSVRLLTAGKYCDRDILVTAEGGGIALDVITASTLPDTVVDGQIVVITDTTPGTVYIDTDAPASPATGDVWVQVGAEATAALTLTEESPYLRNGLVAAAQWNGNSWAYQDGYLGVVGAWQQFAEGFPPVGTALNDMTWEQISAISAAGKAREYFSVGDAKRIVINGAIGNTNFSNVELCAFIIGLDHNSELEGNNTIHFQLFMNNLAGGVKVCLTDSKYASTTTSTGYYNMNTSNINTGGWQGCRMRTTTLGCNSSPSSPLEGSLLAALPSDLRNVMRSINKYTNNTGGATNSAAYVTNTIEFLWLLSEFEVYGVRKEANSAEQNYQKQYEYYSAGNNRVFYKYDATTTASYWWLRSPCAANGYFCLGGTTGDAVNRDGAHTSYGIAPAFCV